MKHHHTRTPPTMSDEERTALMLRLRRRGWTLAQIGKQVGMSKNGVMQALRRTTQPSRYYHHLEEEVDDGPPREDW